MMRLPKMDYQAPVTMSEACALMSEHGKEAKLLAGGTDLIVACKLRNLKPRMLVSLGAIPALRGVRFDEKVGLRIGAMTNLSTLHHDPQVAKHYPALAEAAAAVGATQLQHMGTLGGNLCLETRCMYYNQSESWRKARAVCLKMDGDVCHGVTKGKKCYAAFSGDTAPALMSLGAELKLVSSAGERTLSLSGFYTGDGKDPLAIRPDEILEEIRIPPPAGKEGSTYLKYRVRGAIDFPLAGVAVRLVAAGGLCGDCAVVVGAVASAPRLVPAAGELLKGKPLTEELIGQAAHEAAHAAQPVVNVCGATPTYRRQITEIMARRALTALARNLALM